MPNNQTLLLVGLLGVDKTQQQLFSHDEWALDLPMLQPAPQPCQSGWDWGIHWRSGSLGAGKTPALSPLQQW